ncbi:unnamed protein product [Durusdinium trenchii]|uniref:Solute carrier family 40 protein n=1 Tax=Durusdinium trenchii TaxID=1381693 RepID=A0ABP0KW75_9DINO
MAIHGATAPKELCEPSKTSDGEDPQLGQGGRSCRDCNIQKLRDDSPRDQAPSLVFPEMFGLHGTTTMANRCCFLPGDECRTGQELLQRMDLADSQRCLRGILFNSRPTAQADVNADVPQETEDTCPADLCGPPRPGFINISIGEAFADAAVQPLADMHQIPQERDCVQDGTCHSVISVDSTGAKSNSILALKLEKKDGENGEEDANLLSGKAVLCLQSWCSDRDSTWWQIIVTICYMTGFGVSLALVVLWAYVAFPFQKPEMGFGQNWMFNFVAHPVANYIVARAPVSWFLRLVSWDLESRPSLQKARRPDIARRIDRSLHWAPMVDSVWCACEHALFSLGNVYPVPFSAIISCIPAAFVSVGVAYLVLPAEVRALHNTSNSLKFATCSWARLCAFYGVMLLYTAFFGVVKPEIQMVMSLSVAAVEAFAIKMAAPLGVRWNVPPQIIQEMRTSMRLPVIIFKAMILSEAKGIWVLVTMILPEASQVGGSFLIVLFDLSSYKSEIEKRRMRSSQQFKQGFMGVRHNLMLLQTRIRDITQRCKTMKKQDLQDAVLEAGRVTF